MLVAQGLEVFEKRGIIGSEKFVEGVENYEFALRGGLDSLEHFIGRLQEIWIKKETV